MDPFSSAFMGHLVGDYLLQNDWMARGKKQSDWICAVHAGLWTTAVCLFAGLGGVAWFWLCLSHWFQDRYNAVPWLMDRLGQREFRTGPCSPWSIIVVDNVLHLLTVWVVLKVGV